MSERDINANINANIGLTSFVERIVSIERDVIALDRLIHSQLDGHSREHQLITTQLEQFKDNLKSTLDSLREEFDNDYEIVNNAIKGQFEGHAREHKMLGEAVDEFKSYLKIKLTEMNEVRAQISIERGQYVLNDSINPRIDNIHERLNKIENTLSGLLGKVAGMGAVITFITLLISLILRFWGK